MTSTTTTTEPAECCEILILSSSGGISQTFPELLGKYGEHIGDEENNRKVWLHQTDVSINLHYTIGGGGEWEGWVVSLERYDTFGKIKNRGAKLCPVGLTDGWEYYQPWGWEYDTTLRVTCDQYADKNKSGK